MDPKIIRSILCLVIAALAAACSKPQTAAPPASQSGLVETSVAGTLQAVLSATPVPSETSTETPTPEVPAGWVVYKNEKFGIEFAHPNLYDCKDQCGIQAFIGEGKSIANLAVENTIQWGTDASYDGISFDVIMNPDAIPLQDFVEGERQAILQGPGLIGPPTGVSPYEAGGQTGVKMSLQGTISSAIYIPFPNSHQILIISIGNHTEGSFEATADQILATLHFIQ